MQRVRLPAIRHGQRLRIVEVITTCITNTRNQITTISTTCRKGHRVVSTRDKHNITTEIHIPWVARSTNIRTAHTVHNVQRVTRPASSVSKSTVGNQLNRSSTCIRTSIHTCVSASIHTCVSTCIRTCVSKIQILSTNMTSNKTHVVNINFTNIMTHVENHSARTSEVATIGRV